MDNRQLDALVAQARGWVLNSSDGRIYRPDGSSFEGPLDDRFDEKLWRPYCLPPVSTDIAEAMALVEELGNWHGFDFLMRLDAGYDGWWYVGWFEEGHEGPEDRCTARASTLPEAICLAYLKAKGVEV